MKYKRRKTIQDTCGSNKSMTSQTMADLIKEAEEGCRRFFFGELRPEMKEIRMNSPENPYTNGVYYDNHRLFKENKK